MDVSYLYYILRASINIVVYIEANYLKITFSYILWSNYSPFLVLYGKITLKTDMNIKLKMYYDINSQYFNDKFIIKWVIKKGKDELIKKWFFPFLIHPH